MEQLSIERVHTKNAHFSWVKVYQDSENLCVSGKVRSRHNIKRVRIGHVDVTIITPAITIFKKIGTLHYTRRLPRKIAGGSNFSVHIPINPSRGTIVRVKYHYSLSIPPEERLQKEEKGSPETGTIPRTETYSKFTA